MNTQYERGSVLVFSLLVLSMLLAMAVSAVSITIATKNSARSTEKSTLAFQLADGAAENVLKRVYRDSDSTLDDLRYGLFRSSGANPPTCDNGVISGVLPSSAGTYTVTFYDNSDAQIGCTANGWRASLKYIVAVGSFAGTTRAISVGIESPSCGKVTDADDNEYDCVQIGDQYWLKQNMRVGTRINGGSPQTDNGIVERYCYDDDPNNCTSNHPNQPDGGLYTWGEAMQYSTTEGAQGICPNGWHIPTDTEQFTLEDYLKDAGQTCDANRDGFGCSTAGTKLMPSGTSGWEGNLAGFGNGVSFHFRSTSGHFWSSSEIGAIAWYRELNSGIAQVNRHATVKSRGFSVRCIKD